MNTAAKAMVLGGAILTLAAPALAQNADKLSVESTPIIVLLANPIARPILDRTWPGLSGVGLTSRLGYSLRDLESLPEARLDDARLIAIQTELEAAAASGAADNRPASTPPVRPNSPE